MENSDNLEERVIILEEQMKTSKCDIQELKTGLSDTTKEVSVIKDRFHAFDSKIDKNYVVITGLIRDTNNRLKSIEEDKKDRADKLNTLLKYDIPKVILTVILTAVITAIITLLK